MKISIYDQSLTRILIIDERFVSCLWSEGYNTTENFTLELQENSEYKSKIQTDFYVGRNDRKTLMVIKAVNIQNGKIVISGKQATHVLDDVSFVGTINANSRIDTAIESAYNNSNKFVGLSVVSGGISDVYKHQISNKSFLKLLETMCQSEDVGFRSVKRNEGIFVEFYKPSQKENLVFSQNFGNLFINSVGISTMPYKNYAIVLGGGEGSQRVRVDIDQTRGDHRRDIIVDARDLKKKEGETESNYISRLSARGIEKLLECQKFSNYAFTPLAQDFGIKYDLGDVLTILMPEYGLKLQSRLVRFSQKAQNNRTETTIELGQLIIKR